MITANHGYRFTKEARFPDFFKGYDNERRLDHIAAVAFDKEKNKNIPPVTIQAAKIFCDYDAMNTFWTKFKRNVKCQERRNLFLMYAEFSFMEMESVKLKAFDKSMKELMALENAFMNKLSEYRDTNMSSVLPRNHCRHLFVNGDEYTILVDAIRTVKKRHDEIRHFLKHIHELEGFIPTHKNRRTAACRYAVNLFSRYFHETCGDEGEKLLLSLIDTLFQDDEHLGYDGFRKAYKENLAKDIAFARPWPDPTPIPRPRSGSLAL